MLILGWADKPGIFIGFSRFFAFFVAFIALLLLPGFLASTWSGEIRLEIGELRYVLSAYVLIKKPPYCIFSLSPSPYISCLKLTSFGLRVMFGPASVGISSGVADSCEL
jgi:hypothetical protein